MGHLSLDIKQVNCYCQDAMILYAADLIRALAKKHRRPQTHYHAATTELLAEISTQLSRGHTIRLIGFGSFYTRHQPTSTVKDLRSGKKITIPAHRVAAFRAGAWLKNAVRTQHRAGRPRKHPRATA
jgi:DNA-binding protein HU-beta